MFQMITDLKKRVFWRVDLVPAHRPILAAEPCTYSIFTETRVQLAVQLAARSAVGACARSAQNSLFQGCASETT
jgi:hypothetical protein